MKSTKATIMAALALSAPSLFSQEIVDICGSTAGRGAVHAQILALMPGCTFAFEGATASVTASSSARVIYKGTFNGSPYTIRTSWAGSVDGVQYIALQTAPASRFIDVSVTGVAGGVRVEGPALEPVTGENAKAEIGFSDVFQTSTVYSSPTLEEEAEVGIIPFKWFKNDGDNALNNITSLQARGLYQALGELPLSQFTGVAADVNTPVYCTGRNADSGSRVTTMAEIGYGVFNRVVQYQGTVDGSGAIATLTSTGNNGYSSGSNVAALLGGTYGSGIVVGYLGASDWTSAVNGNARELSYNGIPYSPAAVQEGRYTFWGYLHQNRMSLSANGLAFYNALRDGLIANPGSVLIKDDADMKVSREGDGAPVFLK